MKYVALLLLILLAGCKVTSNGDMVFQPVVLEAPVVIAPEKAPTPPPAAVDPAPAVITPVPEEAPAEREPERRNSIVQYTIKSCGWCVYDRQKVLPKLVSKGWLWRNDTDHVVDETNNPQTGGYPRYEIYDAKGEKTVHHGSLLTWKP